MIINYNKFMRLFFKIFILLFFSTEYLSTQTTANIIINPDSLNIPINPMVFSSGDEIDAVLSPLNQIQPLINLTNTPMLRFGGISAEYFDWEGDDYSGLIYVDFFDTFTLPLTVNFGLDSLLRLCEDLNIQPILTVNMHINDTGLARRMVEYVNGDSSSPLGSIRASRGHPQPYNVSIWSLGNEPDIAGLELPLGDYIWTMYRHFNFPFSSWSWQDSSFWTVYDFANLIPAYVQAMEQSSPIPLEFIYSISGYENWLRPVIQPNLNLIDYLDVHYYPSGTFDTVFDSTDYIEWLRKTDTINPAENYVQKFRDSLAAMGADRIEVVVLEYNGGINFVADSLWWNYLTGLFIADCIGHWMNCSLSMASVYSIHEGSPSDTSFPLYGIIRGDIPSRRLASYVLELYSQYFGDSLIYSHSDHVNSGYGIEAWSSKRNRDKKYVCMVINKTLDTTYQVCLEILDSVMYIELRDICQDAPLSAPFNGTTGIHYQGLIYPDSSSSHHTYFNITFEPKSISLLEITLPQSTSVQQPGPVDNLQLIPTLIYPGMRIVVNQDNYRLFSVSGQKIKEWINTETIVIPSLPGGLYFFQTGLNYRKVLLF